MKFTKQQQQALKGSIRKWVKIVNGTGRDKGPDNCPCCEIWFNKQPRLCVGCPIHQVTGKVGCSGTPYQEYIKTERSSEAERVAAVSELLFLKAIAKAGG